MAESMEEIEILEDIWPRSSDDYDLYKIIGRGITSTVYKSFCKARRESCAIKRVDLEKSDLIYLYNEIRSLSLCRHPNVIKLYTSFYVDREVWVVMRLMNRGSLRQILDLHIEAMGGPNQIKFGVLNNNVIATLLKYILRGLDYLHDKGHIHRDIKSANILISSTGDVQLADFGFSTWLPGIKRINEPLVGTPCYMAPEVTYVYSEVGYNNKIDIWSLGITTLEMAAGYPPYYHFLASEILRNVRRNDPPSLASYTYGNFRDYDEVYRHFISSCLQKTPNDRWTAERLLQHPFVRENSKSRKYLVRALLEAIPFTVFPIDGWQRSDVGHAEESLRQADVVDEKEAWDFNISAYKNRLLYKIDNFAPYVPPRIKPQAELIMSLYLMQFKRGRRESVNPMLWESVEYDRRISVEEQVFKMVRNAVLDTKYVTIILAKVRDIIANAQKENLEDASYTYIIEKIKGYDTVLNIHVDEWRYVDEEEARHYEGGN